MELYRYVGEAITVPGSVDAPCATAVHCRTLPSTTRHRTLPCTTVACQEVDGYWVYQYADRP